MPLDSHRAARRRMAKSQRRRAARAERRRRQRRNRPRRARPTLAPSAERPRPRGDSAMQRRRHVEAIQRRAEFSRSQHHFSPPVNRLVRFTFRRTARKDHERLLSNARGARVTRNSCGPTTKIADAKKGERKTSKTRLGRKRKTQRFLTNFRQNLPSHRGRAGGIVLVQKMVS